MKFLGIIKKKHLGIKAMKIQHIFEPTPLQCGQAVLAMLSGKTVDEIIVLCGTERETTLAQMKSTLTSLGFFFNPERKLANNKEDLPEIAVLSLETPKCWHWSLYLNGTFYDPEYGVLEDFPNCHRKYFFEIKLPYK